MCYEWKYATLGHPQTQVRLIPTEAKPRYVYSILKPHGQEFQKPSQTAAMRGEAELRILNFKTTWSEFQKASLTSAERGEAELHILNFKTTWSEFQKASQNAAERGEAELRVLNFKTTWS